MRNGDTQQWRCRTRGALRVGFSRLRNSAVLAHCYVGIELTV